MGAPDPFSAFAHAAAEYWYQHLEQRRGQAFFNYLLEVRPDIANEVRGTGLDPFHNDGHIDEFLEYVESILSQG